MPSWDTSTCGARQLHRSRVSVTISALVGPQTTLHGQFALLRVCTACAVACHKSCSLTRPLRMTPSQFLTNL
eukprot:6476289-Amphidinium_carterae.1